MTISNVLFSLLLSIGTLSLNANATALGSNDYDENQPVHHLIMEAIVLSVDGSSIQFINTRHSGVTTLKTCVDSKQDHNGVALTAARSKKAGINSVIEYVDRYVNGNVETCISKVSLQE